MPQKHRREVRLFKPREVAIPSPLRAGIAGGKQLEKQAETASAGEFAVFQTAENLLALHCGELRPKAAEVLNYRRPRTLLNGETSGFGFRLLMC